MTSTDERRLHDILDAIQRIRGYVPATLAELEDDIRTQDAIVHRFMIIGEAVSSMSRELRAAHTDVPWSDIAGMRHIIVHDYDRVSLGIVWDAIENHLPRLEATVRDILSKA